MKKLLAMLFAVAMLTVAQTNLDAYSWGDLRDEVEENTRLTVLKTAAPVYLYSFVEGKSLGGVETEFGQYRFFSADLGWANPFDAGEKGTIIGGISLHIDRLIEQSFPMVSKAIAAGEYLLLPRSVLNFWDRLYFGVWAGRNIDKNDIDVGIKSGLALKF